MHTCTYSTNHHPLRGSTIFHSIRMPASDFKRWPIYARRAINWLRCLRPSLVRHNAEAIGKRKSAVEFCSPILTAPIKLNQSKCGFKIVGESVQFRSTLSAIPNLGSTVSLKQICRKLDGPADLSATTTMPRIVRHPELRKLKYPQRNGILRRLFLYLRQSRQIGVIFLSNGSTYRW